MRSQTTCRNFSNSPVTETPSFALRDSDGPDLTPLQNPAHETREMMLWNQELLPTLQRKLVNRSSERRLLSDSLFASSAGAVTVDAGFMGRTTGAAARSALWMCLRQRSRRLSALV